MTNPPDDSSPKSKRADEFVSMRPDLNWRATLRSQTDDPEAMLKSTRWQLDMRNAHIEDQIDRGRAISARNTPDADFAAMQQVVDEMAARTGLFARSPTLVLRTARSLSTAEKSTIFPALPQIFITSEKFMGMTESALDYFRTHMPEFRAAAAHELGHLAMGDREPEALVRSSTRPPNHRAEVLADAMGAIIHGDPVAYASATIAVTRAFNQATGTLDHHYSETHPSVNAISRRTARWATFLRTQGGLDEQGQVIIAKALDLLKDYAELLERMVRVRERMEHPELRR